MPPPGADLDSFMSVDNDERRTVIRCLAVRRREWVLRSGEQANGKPMYGRAAQLVAVPRPYTTYIRDRKVPGPLKAR